MGVQALLSANLQTKEYCQSRDLRVTTKPVFAAVIDALLFPKTTFSGLYKPLAKGSSRSAEVIQVIGHIRNTSKSQKLVIIACE